MGKVIAIANQKGGVGKTTTSINLSACIAEMGKKVLIIDLDPQGNCTSGYGVDKKEVENTVYELLLDEITIKESMMKIPGQENLTLIPSRAWYLPCMMREQIFHQMLCKMLKKILRLRFTARSFPETSNWQKHLRMVNL